MMAISHGFSEAAARRCAPAGACWRKMGRVAAISSKSTLVMGNIRFNSAQPDTKPYRGRTEVSAKGKSSNRRAKACVHRWLTRRPHTDSMPVKVLLVTTVRWPSAGRLAGAFTQAGCGVEVLLPSEHPATHSRYFTRVHSYRPMNGLVSFLDAMTAAEPDLVIPLDDRATSLLLRAHAEGPTDVALLIERSLGNIEAYPLLMSRGGFLAAAWEADIRTPLTFTIADEDELENALSEAGFPAVLK